MSESIDYRQHGYEITYTGGNCMAWRKDYESGCYALITDDTGCDLPDHDAETVSIGMYDAETGEEILSNAWVPTSSHQAIEMADDWGNSYIQE